MPVFTIPPSNIYPVAGRTRLYPRYHVMYEISYISKSFETDPQPSYYVQVVIGRYRLNKAVNSLKPASVAQKVLLAKPLPTGLKASNPRKIGSITHTFGEP